MDNLHKHRTAPKGVWQRIHHSWFTDGEHVQDEKIYVDGSKTVATPKESGWRERLEDLAAINYNLYLAGTVERADTGEKWTHEQALQELKEFIATEIATAIAATEARVVDNLIGLVVKNSTGFDTVGFKRVWHVDIDALDEDLHDLFSSKT
jgi:hypothetical protein